ncbi:MAG: hypothetical protein JXL80_17405 [Planctomycetes bacterium]|nr:hypothetical protein [Planctomycetota bacterium]
MPRFVIQHHVYDDGDEHWDLMFEVGPALRTWSLPKPPDQPEHLPMCVRQLADHRIEYLEYEGEVSDNRGRVAIHDRGSYQWGDEVEAPIDTLNELTVLVEGERLSGRFHLVRTPHEGKDLWRMKRLG